jgi:hypothetical protein
MNDELRDLLSRPTASVPKVGEVCFGLARNAAYAAALRGDFPTKRIGKRIVALTAPLPKILGMDPEVVE